MRIALTEFANTHKERNEGNIDVVSPYNIQPPHDDEISQEQLSGGSGELRKRQNGPGESPLDLKSLQVG